MFPPYDSDYSWHDALNDRDAARVDAGWEDDFSEAPEDFILEPVPGVTDADGWTLSESDFDPNERVF